MWMAEIVGLLSFATTGSSGTVSEIERVGELLQEC
jgi:hypothetical protein